jgi:signal transduction histidine kinase
MSDKYFKISSALKNLIGSDLITDNFVAVFELVKNSFDARATEVKIIFENIYSKDAKIIIQDNGKGMDYEDLTEKWLFLGYSAKKDGTEDYRDKIKSGRVYAGAKGVGRFSCDRLGKYLNLITLSEKPKSKIENIFVDWAKFERDQKIEFKEIPVTHQILKSTKYDLEKGTVLEINGITNDFWNRDNFKRLKEKLSKLIRPDLNTSEEVQKFKIILSVPEEQENDREVIKKFKQEGNTEIEQYYNTINGEIKNFVFNELDIKTTRIESGIDENGIITTRLTDRENFVYEINERSEFDLLKNVGITLYFLNRSAKVTFKKRTGVEHIDFGSLFIYKNGFRIYPYGERGDDSLGIDNRALQGYARYIGLRSLIGEISIQGTNAELRETTSRGDGLLKTKTYNELINKEDGYLIKTLRRLEKYVIDVTQWGVNEDDDHENLSSETVKENLVKLIANISDDKAIQSLTYNKDIVSLISNKEEKSAKKLVKNFKRIAAESNNKQLYKEANRIEKAITSALKAKESAEKESLLKDAEKKKIEAELEQQISETLFARADRGTDKDDLLSIQHHIFRHAAQHITNYIEQLVDSINNNLPKNKLLEIASKISFENKKIITLSRFVTKAQFDTTVSKINTDLVTFINEYVLNVYQEYKHLVMNNQKLKIKVNNSQDLKFLCSFRPIEVIIILDNLLNNSFKAKAKKVLFEWENINNNEIILHISDDGIGISENNLQNIFKARFTTTNGSGLGLYHTKEIVEKMGGSITVNNMPKQGVEFILKFKK